MKDYQKRVVQERDELKDKLDKLKGFLLGLTFDKLPVDEKERLVKQSNIMTQYLKVLNDRIEAFDD